MAIYMQINGMNGNVTAKGHEQWIQLKSIDFNVQRNLSSEPGRLADRESTRPTVSQFTITKKMDQTTPLLFSESCVGQAKPEIKIDICQSGSQLTPYMQYTLSNVIVSGYQVGTPETTPDQAGSEYPVETVTLSFDKIEMKYTPFDEQNKPQSPIPAGYDLKQATAV